MEYREIGKTGLKGSIIGLGCEHLDGKPFAQVNETVSTALENGVNILDVFMPGKEIRENIAKSIGTRRKDVLIQGHIGSTDISQQYDISRDLPVVQRYFEDLLRIYGYIDFGMMFFIDSDEDYHNVFETGFADYVLRLKNAAISAISALARITRRPPSAPSRPACPRCSCSASTWRSTSFPPKQTRLKR